MTHVASSAYAAAGVDIEAGDRAVQLMKSSVKRTERSEVIGGIVNIYIEKELR